MLLAALPRDAVLESATLHVCVAQHETIGFILEIRFAGKVSLLDIAYVAQSIREFLEQPVPRARHILFDISGAELVTLTQVQAFVQEMVAMKPLLAASLRSSVVRASSALLANPLIRNFRQTYRAVRPNTLVGEEATAESVLDFFAQHAA